jgi:hypothetical protein
MSSRNRERQADIVTIRTELDPTTTLVFITGVSIIGSVSPCGNLLREGRRVGPAVSCLEQIGFDQICERSNLLVFRRMIDTTEA